MTEIFKIREDVPQPTIVVARYNEDVTWLEPIASYVTLYNKGPPLPDAQSRVKFKRVIALPNVGREAHTYIHHILEHYSEMAENPEDITVFIQGKIDDHVHNATLKAAPHIVPLALAKDAVAHGHSRNSNTYPGVRYMGAVPEFSLRNYYKSGGIARTPFRNLGHWLFARTELTFEPPIPWYKNALFAVKNKLITRHPRSLYENLMQDLDKHPNPEAAHYLERTWHLILVGSCQEQDKSP